jgi:hypothetical protein
MQPQATVKIPYKLTNDEEFITDVAIYNYTEKSVAITCTEHFGRAFTEQLKTIASYNPKLKIGKGWILSNSKYPALQELTAKIRAFEIKGAIPPVYRRKSVCLCAPIIEPSIITSFKNIISLLAEEKESKTVYTTPEHTYVWGKKDDVFSTIVSMQKEIINQFDMGEKCIVITN